jgi:hypothetical protein
MGRYGTAEYALKDVSTDDSSAIPRTSLEPAANVYPAACLHLFLKMSVASILKASLYYFLVAYLVGMGGNYLLVSYGTHSLPDSIRYSPGNPPIDKFAAGAAALGLTLNAFIAMVGTCKFSAGVALLLFPGSSLALLANVLAIVYHICVAVGHYYIDGLIVGPLVVGALLLLNLVLQGAAAPPTKSGEHTA